MDVTLLNRRTCLGVGIGSIYVLISCMISCRSTTAPGSLDDVPAKETDEFRVDPGWPKSATPYRQASYARRAAPLPTIAGAEYVNEDGLCSVCHKAYAESFEQNVHRQQNCESCHGPASRHLETRGEEGTILAFDQMEPIQKSEVCAQCHEQDGCSPGEQWRTSVHAARGVACTDCHTDAHYRVPAGTPTITVAAKEKFLDSGDWRVIVASYRAQLEADAAEPEELDSSDPALPSLRGTSNNLGAVAPVTCYRCHERTQELEIIAHPHQIGGEHGFNCTTCHAAHGNVIESSRTDLCMQCHEQSPTHAWHSSTHHLVGVACTDCHNPHPSTSVQPVTYVRHTSVERPQRLPMAVNDPVTCYKCHPKVFGELQMPSHHPVPEGKMKCADCHEPHGQGDRHLKDGLGNETVNALCYKCHSDKEGPFVYEHPPVTQDCSICHNPHGTVTNNLLHQPPSILCLRCHTGHWVEPPDHFGLPVANIDDNPLHRAAYYSDCTQCHSQIHGTDLPSQRNRPSLLR
jgi:DmsE family decaheme c-type cytochrome